MVICIIGLGYVGLPLSLAFSNKNIEVIGYDNSLKRVNELKKYVDINREYSQSKLLGLKNIGFTSKVTDIAKANVYNNCP